MKRNIRWINKYNFSRFASIAVAVLLVLELVSLVMSAIVYRSYDTSNFGSLLSAIISLVFLLLVCNYFYKSRDNLYYGFYAILLLLLSEYIIPLILNLFLGILSGAIAIILPSLVTVVAIVYFVFIALENRKREKKYSTGLMITGFIFAGVAIAYAIMSLISYGTLLSSLIDSGTSWSSMFDTILMIVEYIVEILAFPLIFASYPLVLRKERMY